MTEKLAVFDWNCTLFDDFQSNLDAANKVLEIFDRSPITAKRYREAFMFPILHSYVNLGIGTDEYLSRHEEAAKTFLKHYEEGAMECGLRAGTLETLQWLQDNGVHCLLLTNHLQENVEEKLRKFLLTDFFDTVSGRDQYDASFISKMNKEERLEAYMKEHGFKPENAFIIGDSHEEPEIGNHLGLTTFCITGGLLNNERLEACNPDYIVDDIFGLHDVLQDIWTF